MSSRNTSDFIKLFFKGCVMGVADALPGISGGTIALLVGIYEELISTIGSLNFKLFKEIGKKGFSSFWNKLNGNFLLAVISGQLISLITLIAIFNLISENYKALIWAFFMGLIFATIYIIFKLIKDCDILDFILIIVSVIMSLLITSVSPNNPHEISNFYIFSCGLIASSALILPGISGATMLILLGVYPNYLSDSLVNFDIVTLVAFTSGAIIGLLGFSRILKYLFKYFRNKIYSIILGLLAGSIKIGWEEWNKEFGGDILNINLFLSIVLLIFGFTLILFLDKKKK